MFLTGALDVDVACGCCLCLIFQQRTKETAKMVCFFPSSSNLRFTILFLFLQHGEEENEQFKGMEKSKRLALLRGQISNPLLNSRMMICNKIKLDNMVDCSSEYKLQSICEDLAALKTAKETSCSGSPPPFISQNATCLFLHCSVIVAAVLLQSSSFKKRKG